MKFYAPPPGTPVKILFLNIPIELLRHRIPVGAGLAGGFDGREAGPPPPEFPTLAPAPARRPHSK